MFNRNEERKIKEFKGTTIYLTKYENVNVERYLDMIVRSIERFVRQNGVMPKKLRLGYDNYNKIIHHNKTLIEQKHNKYYTFGVEIEV